MSGRLAILIPAAGASRRMGGRDKLLEAVADGRSLLRDRIAVARATGLPVLVALPPRAIAPERWRHAEGATRVEIAPWPCGMGDSLAALVSAISEPVAGALILPADMPDIDTADLNKMMQSFDSSAIFRGVSAAGIAGHPVVFPRSMFSALGKLTGDKGGHALLENAQIRHIPLPSTHATTDLDTPEAWAKWRAAQVR